MFGSGSHLRSSTEAVVYLTEVISVGTVLKRADLTKITIQ